MNFMSFVSTYWHMIIYAAIAGVVAFVVLIWSKHKWAWICGILIVTWGLVLLGWLGMGWLGKTPELDKRLPATFRVPLGWWLFGLVIGGIWLLVWVLKRWRRPVATLVGEGEEGAAQALDVRAAWNEILGSMHAARLDPAEQELFLFVGPDAAAVDELIAAAELQLFVNSPRAGATPVRAYCVAEGLLLNAAAAGSVTQSGPGGVSPLEQLCEILHDLDPDQPRLGGIVLVLPLAWATSDVDAVRVARIRDDLQTIQSVFRVRSPAFVVMSGLEQMVGAREFLDALSPAMLARRCGFVLPHGETVNPADISRGLVWLTQWFEAWCLRSMAERGDQARENGRMFSLYESIRRERDGLIHLLTAIFQQHPQTEPLCLRGIYLAATGKEPATRGFTGGLLRGTRSHPGRIFEEAGTSEWSRKARASDRRDRVLAIVLAVIALSVAAAVWLIGVISALPAGRTRQAAWVLLGVLGGSWIVGLAAHRLVLRPRPRPARV